jgi:phytoene synthase
MIEGPHCVMSRDTNFYYSFLVLPPRKRRAIIAVWDFCRAVDDAVDQAVPGDERRGRLSPAAQALAADRIRVWRDELHAIYSGTPHTPQGLGLQPYVVPFRLPRRQFELLIDGVEMDLQHDRYPTFEALAAYCHRVASTVGLICVEIFGYQDPGARAYAENLGLALQLTNIIRDVAEDLRSGRVYLPLEDLHRFNVTEADLQAGVMTTGVRALLRFECNRARSYYRRAAAQLPRVDAASLVAAEIMGAIYFEILRNIERRGHDVFSERVRVPRPRRAALALGIWLRSLPGQVARLFRPRRRRPADEPADPGGSAAFDSSAGERDLGSS